MTDNNGIAAINTTSVASDEDNVKDLGM